MYLSAVSYVILSNHSMSCHKVIKLYFMTHIMSCIYLASGIR